MDESLDWTVFESWRNVQAFVSEYALIKEDAGNGTLLAAVAEAGFLIGLEKNRFSQTFLWNFLFHTH